MMDSTSKNTPEGEYVNKMFKLLFATINPNLTDEQFVNMDIGKVYGILIDNIESKE